MTATVPLERDSTGDRHLLDWVAVGAAALLAGVFGWLWTATGRTAHAVVAVTLADWALAFSTSYWRPVLDVPPPVLTATVAAVCVVFGGWTEPLRQVGVLLSVVFLAATSYLLIYEEQLADAGLLPAERPLEVAAAGDPDGPARLLAA